MDEGVVGNLRDVEGDWGVRGDGAQEGDGEALVVGGRDGQSNTIGGK